jgi:hypothetical protein
MRTGPDDRHATDRLRVARRAGITKRVGPHTRRHAFFTVACHAGVPLRGRPSLRAAGWTSLFSTHSTVVRPQERRLTVR